MCEIFTSVTTKELTG